MKNSILNYLVFAVAALVSATDAFAQFSLGVVNTAGDVWTRDLYIPGGYVGPGRKLAGPALFGGPDAQFVVASGYTIAVVTTSGAFWPREVDWYDNIGPGRWTAGTLFGIGTPNAKYILFDNSCSHVYVVNTQGEIWTHGIISNGVPIAVEPGRKLYGPGLFGGSNDKYVVLDSSRVLVINALGEVWAHELTDSSGSGGGGLWSCPAFDTVQPGYRLDGPPLFGASDDRYVVAAGGYLLVINSAGEVWARSTNRSSVGGGFKLNGPGLFGGNDDAFVVAYYTPQRPPN